MSVRPPPTPQQTWADVTGQATEVIKDGFKTTLLLADNGTVLGERYTSPSAGEATVLYRAYKTVAVADVVLPTEADLYVPGQAAPIARQTTRSIGVNQDLSLAFTPLLYLKTADLEVTPQALTWVRKHAVPFTTVEPGNGFTDLMPLKKSIGTTRIVALGEQTHGTHEFFKMKHRLLEFLVSELGYSVFAIEANMPEAYRLNDYVLTGKGDPAALLKGMYF